MACTFVSPPPVSIKPDPGFKHTSTYYEGGYEDIPDDASPGLRWLRNFLPLDTLDANWEAIHYLILPHCRFKMNGNCEYAWNYHVLIHHVNGYNKELNRGYRHETTHCEDTQTGPNTRVVRMVGGNSLMQKTLASGRVRRLRRGEEALVAHLVQHGGRWTAYSVKLWGPDDWDYYYPGIEKEPGQVTWRSKAAGKSLPPDPDA